MSSKFNFIDFLRDYDIGLDEFMDMYCEFAELDSDTRLEIIQEYARKISGDES